MVHRRRRRRRRRLIDLHKRLHIIHVAPASPRKKRRKQQPKKRPKKKKESAYEKPGRSAFAFAFVPMHMGRPVFFLPSRRLRRGPLERKKATRKCGLRARVPRVCVMQALPTPPTTHSHHHHEKVLLLPLLLTQATAVDVPRGHRRRGANIHHHRTNDTPPPRFHPPTHPPQPPPTPHSPTTPSSHERPGQAPRALPHLQGVHGAGLSPGPGGQDLGGVHHPPGR